MDMENVQQVQRLPRPQELGRRFDVDYTPRSCGENVFDHLFDLVRYLLDAKAGEYDPAGDL